MTTHLTSTGHQSVQRFAWKVSAAGSGGECRHDQKTLQAAGTVCQARVEGSGYNGAQYCEFSCHYFHNPHLSLPLLITPSTALRLLSLELKTRCFITFVSNSWTLFTTDSVSRLPVGREKCEGGG